MYKDSTGKYTTNFTNITKNTYNGIMCTNRGHPEFPDDEYNDKYIATVLKSGNLYNLFSIVKGISSKPFFNLTESDINTILMTCPHIMAPWTF